MSNKYVYIGPSTDNSEKILAVDSLTASGATCQEEICKWRKHRTPKSNRPGKIRPGKNRQKGHHLQNSRPPRIRKLKLPERNRCMLMIGGLTRMRGTVCSTKKQ